MILYLSWIAFSIYSWRLSSFFLFCLPFSYFVFVGIYITVLNLNRYCNVFSTFAQWSYGKEHTTYVFEYNRNVFEYNENEEEAHLSLCSTGVSLYTYSHQIYSAPCDLVRSTFLFSFYVSFFQFISQPILFFSFSISFMIFSLTRSFLYTPNIFH